MSALTADSACHTRPAVGIGSMVDQATGRPGDVIVGVNGQRLAVRGERHGRRHAAGEESPLAQCPRVPQRSSSGAGGRCVFSLGLPAAL